MFAVEVKELTKKYNDKTAVDGISLQINEGELFSLLGVNGAGKTTTVKVLSCLTDADGGEAFVLGKNCSKEKDAVKALIGISPQETSVAEKLTVRENLRLIAEISGFDKEKCSARVEQTISELGLGEVADSLAKTLSGGWKRKLSIAMALISEPKVLFLDEPTLGLDVLARRELWKVIESLKGRITMILTTHYMEEAQQLSDRIAVMVSGKIKALGTLSELEALTGKQGLEEAFVAIAEGSV
ncbi:ABC-2 type transport system ATP-binding protein [Ruminococcaceae bacterium FB2012]|nr:ABC-2 type transport system ATP-binding protein [Ruminococcaceae bacterium FB2012]